MLRILLGIFLFFALAASATAQSVHTGDGFPFPAPPPADANPVVDNYNGAKIPDSYRWLEDSKSPETRAFIDAQNAYTSHYLKLAHIRVQAVDDLSALEQVSQWTMPMQRGDNYYLSLIHI